MKKTLFENIVLESVINNPSVYGYEKLNEITINNIINKHGNSGFIILSAQRSVIMPKNFNGEEPDGNSLLGKFLKDVKIDHYDKKDAEMAVDTPEAQEWLRTRNKQADAELETDIRDFGNSYSKVFGGYKEDMGAIPSFEPSFVVYNKDRQGNETSMNELMRFGAEMCAKYEQECFLVKRPGQPACYVDKDGRKISKTETDNTKINREGEQFFTTTKRDKHNNQQFTNDINFPDDNDDYTPEKIFEGKYYCKYVEYYDKMKRAQKGEIFL